MRAVAALFDLDGTLADTARDLHAAAAAMLRDLSLPPVSEVEARGFIGDGMPRFIKRLITRQWWGEPPPELLARAQARVAAHYAAVCTRSPLYEGVAAALETLRGRGVRLGCVTNKNTCFAMPILRARGILEEFSVVVCGDTLAVKKPHPAPLLEAMRGLDAPAARTVMVGDSLADSRAAAAAGCRFVCMGYGYHREAPPAAAVAARFGDIPDLVAPEARAGGV